MKKTRKSPVRKPAPKRAPARKPSSRKAAPKQPANATTAPKGGPPPITLGELIARLGDPAVDPKTLIPYLEVREGDRHNGLAPTLYPNPEVVRTDGPENAAARARGDIGLGFLNGVYRTRRRILFEETRSKRPDAPILLAEGDSWFEYPVFLKDVVDCLIDDHRYNVFCLSSAGAELKTMLRTEEYASYLKHLVGEGLKVKAFLLSAGGNDIVGPELAKLLVKFKANSKPADLVQTGKLAAAVANIEKGYREIFADVHKVVPKLPILIHGYDYGPALPDQGFQVPPLDGWLGKPMREMGITEDKVQQGIVKIIMDAMNEMLRRLDQANAGVPDVHYVDNRNVVGKHWHDELHPDDAGFGLVTKRFHAVIGKLP